MPILQTPRLLLREFLSADWEAVNHFLSNLEVTRYTHFAKYDEAQRRAWFNWCLENDRLPERDAYNWAIALPDTNQVIGWLGIGSPSRPSMARERDFGYILNRVYWNQGYMTEALRSILNYEFRELGTLRIFATCEIPNIASARVMEKVGMRHEGIFCDGDFEGNWTERHRYGISREEFLGI
jgi:RimJ/RimL family protein N-acetyltransferase